MSREKLSNRRPGSETLPFEFQGHAYLLSYLIEQGRARECFLRLQKADGSQLYHQAHDLAKMVSRLLQHGDRPLDLGHTFERAPALDGQPGRLLPLTLFGAVVDQLAALEMEHRIGRQLPLAPEDGRCDIEVAWVGHDWLPHWIAQGWSEIPREGRHNDDRPIFRRIGRVPAAAAGAKDG
jgi:hypothetical protein